jgi:hypothetical protein
MTEVQMPTLAIALLCLVVALSPLAVPAQAPHEGFGAATPGGAGQPVYRVTNLNNSGPGSLRDAVSQSNRYVVFDVGGTINLVNELAISRKSFITIDGATAPSPGITLITNGLVFDGSHNIIVRHLRSRNAADDGFTVYHSHDILFDHVSSANAADGSLDITEGSYNITVQWSIFQNLAASAAQEDHPGNMLIGYAAKWVTIHHNLFTGRARNPYVDAQAGGLTRTPAPIGELVADIRNNVIWDWGAGGGAQWGSGTSVDLNARANVVNNFYQANGTYRNLANLTIDLNQNGSGAQVYTSGNISGNGVNVNPGNVFTPFAAAPVTTEHACTAAGKILQQAGAQPLDAVDRDIVSRVSLARCPGGGPVVVPAAPSNLLIR